MKRRFNGVNSFDLLIECHLDFQMHFFKNLFYNRLHDTVELPVKMSFKWTYLNTFLTILPGLVCQMIFYAPDQII